MDNKVQRNHKPLDIMTLSEVAAYLKLAEKTVLRMVHKGSIPAMKIASQWRFLRSVINEWLLTQQNFPVHNDLATLIQSESELVPLARIIDEDYIILNLKPDTKEEILRQLIAPLTNRDILKNEEWFLEKLLYREQLASTAMGRGVAFPHLRRLSENPKGAPPVLLGVCPEGTDFAAFDHLNTQLFFLLCSESEVIHLRIMAKLTTMLQKNRLIARLATAKSKEEVISILIQQEKEENSPFPSDR
jgi:PTS system nitrogen regulatory IIA component